MMPTDRSPASSFIHRNLFLLRAHYCLYFSAYGMIVPILSITLRSRGLFPTEIFYANVIIPFLTFLTTPFIGFIADHSRRYICMMNILLCLVTCVYAFLFTLPSVKSYPIRADMHQTTNMQYVLDFCTHDELSVQCALRSECGCIYQASCRPIMLDDSTVYKPISTFNFTFEMNSNHFDYNRSTSCEIHHRISINRSLIELTMNETISKS